MRSLVLSVSVAAFASSWQHASGFVPPPTRMARKAAAKPVESDDAVSALSFRIPVRSSAHVADDAPKSEKMRYSSEDWLENLVTIPQSNIYRRISKHLAANTIWAIFIAALDDFKPELFRDIPTTPHSVMSSALALLLVFRTNASYDRFWEARKVWGSIVNKSREMAVFVFSSLDPVYHLTLGAWVCVAPFAMKQHLQNKKDPEELLNILSDFGVELNEEEKRWFFQQENMPLVIFKYQQEALKIALRGGVVPDGSDGRNRFLQRSLIRPFGPPRPFSGVGVNAQAQQSSGIAAGEQPPFADLEYSALYVAPMMVRAQQMVGDMIDFLGRCERILKSPVPLSYSRHTSRLLTIFCGTLPMVLAKQLGELTVPVMFMVGWGLFGIEEIGHYIEEPFGIETASTLGLPGICSTIERGVKGILSENERFESDLDAASVSYASTIGQRALKKQREQEREGNPSHMLQQEGQQRHGVEGMFDYSHMQREINGGHVDSLDDFQTVGSGFSTFLGAMRSDE